MLNKTKDYIYMSDDNICYSNELYSEHYLLSKYISRDNIDKLKSTPWFGRRKKWKVPFRYNDIIMIKETIHHHPDDWELFLYDTIILSEYRHWIDWLITETYECWHNKNHADLNRLKHKHNKLIIMKNQLSALITLYKNNVALAGETLISETENKLSECRTLASALENDIDSKQQTVLFTLRDMYDAFRARIYHSSALKHDHFPDELQVIIDSVLLLKENNNNEFLHEWLYQKNICFYDDTLFWC